MATRIKEKYVAEAVPALKQKFGYKNVMEVPKLAKIVINMGLGDCKDNAKAMEMAVNELTTIAGQKPMVTKAKKSIANFKVREGMNVGAKVTLRGVRMEEFMDKLVSVALPRVRDFRGVSAKAFDGRGNYSLGIREQLLFPEIEYDKVEKIRGMEIVFVTTAKTDEECRELLSLLGMPFEQAYGGERKNGKTEHETQAAERAQVLHARLHPVPHLRPAAQCTAQVRRVPYLLPGTGLQGTDPRRPQGQLVSGKREGGLENGCERPYRRYAHPHPERTGCAA